MTNSNLGDVNYSEIAAEIGSTFSNSAFGDLIVVTPQEAQGMMR